VLCARFDSCSAAHFREESAMMRVQGYADMTSAPGALTLTHLNLDVADLARSEHFYGELLALPVTRRESSLSIRWAGGFLVLAQGRANPAGTLHFGFRVADDAAVDAWFTRLGESDAAIVERPVARGSVYVGRVRDPDGYPIEIYADHADA
jgi:catechol 2,3-dioxygenase-like lactoylglutathione lyase family enzyme